MYRATEVHLLSALEIEKKLQSSLIMKKTLNVVRCLRCDRDSSEFLFCVADAFSERLRRRGGGETMTGSFC